MWRLYHSLLYLATETQQHAHPRKHIIYWNKAIAVNLAEPQSSTPPKNCDMGPSPRLCTSNYHWRWPIYQTSILNQSLIVMSVFHQIIFVFTGYIAKSASSACWSYSEAVEVKWKKLSAILDFGSGCHTKLWYTALENDPDTLCEYVHFILLNLACLRLPPGRCEGKLRMKWPDLENALVEYCKAWLYIEMGSLGTGTHCRNTQLRNRNTLQKYYQKHHFVHSPI